MYFCDFVVLSLFDTNLHHQTDNHCYNLVMFRKLVLFKVCHSSSLHTWLQSCCGYLYICMDFNFQHELSSCSECKCVLLPLKISVDQSNRSYDLKKYLYCHAPGSSVLGSPRSSAYRDVCVQVSTSRLPEPTPLTVYRSVPPVPPPLDSNMVDYTNVH
jgi:hypothetical protein